MIDLIVEYRGVVFFVGCLALAVVSYVAYNLKPTTP